MIMNRVDIRQGFFAVWSYYTRGMWNISLQFSLLNTKYCRSSPRLWSCSNTGMGNACTPQYMALLQHKFKRCNCDASSRLLYSSSATLLGLTNYIIHEVHFPSAHCDSAVFKASGLKHKQGMSCTSFSESVLSPIIFTSNCDRLQSRHSSSR